MKLTKKQLLITLNLIDKRIQWLESLDSPNEAYLEDLSAIQMAILTELAKPKDKPKAKAKLRRASRHKA